MRGDVNRPTSTFVTVESTVRPTSPRAASPVLNRVGDVVFAIGAALLIGVAWRRTAAASTIVTSGAHR